MAVLLSAGTARAEPSSDRVVLLARVGPWSAVSEMIGYRGRLWFVNSVKYTNHNSADVYSHDPRHRHARLDRPGDPPWPRGDVVGALSALSGKRFGYNVKAWRRW